MFKFSRILVAYAIAIPLALYLGYLVVSPGTFTFGVIGLLLFFLALPLFLKWHHVLLIVFWNSIFNIALLPGSPDVWLLCAAISFGISFLNHIMFQKKFLRAPELTRPVLFFTAIILMTGWIRGGIGVRAFGGASYGGRNYLYVLGAIVGYFAFTAEAIPLAKARKLGDWFFLSGTSFALSNVIYTLGPAFYILFYIVPSSGAIFQATSNMGLTDIDRISGLGPACKAALCFLLAHYGIRGLFDWGKPWRLLFLIVTVAGAFFAGFRSVLMILCLIFAIQFYYEGLLRTHYFPIVIGLALCGFAPLLFFSKSMPPVVQRTLSFLPVNVDSDVLVDAKASSEWRFEMWAVVIKEIPKYFWLGKGYSLDPNEIFAAVESARLGIASSPFEGSMVAGDYHSGPLSVIIPFGIFGAIAFCWVLYGGYRVLSNNYRFGDAKLRRLNSVILAYYLAHTIAFFFVFGALNSELSLFLGLCGFSISLNGGVKRRAVPKSKPLVEKRTMAMQPG